MLTHLLQGPSPVATTSLRRTGITAKLPGSLLRGLSASVRTNQRAAARNNCWNSSQLNAQASDHVPQHATIPMACGGPSTVDNIDGRKNAGGGVFFLDQFALRQWNDPHYSGTRIEYNPEEFVQRIEELHAAGAPLVAGYADFCKHIFVPNFVAARVSCLPINESNVGLLRSGYRARTPAELPVLTRWFPRDSVATPPAQMLDVIVYSREQLELERASMAASGAEPSVPLPSLPWGIISIKAQDEGEELPMQPITMIRNALGREEGGSGVSLDKAAYGKAVQYWEHHASIMD